MEPHIQSRIVKISVPAENTVDLHWHFTGYVLCDGLILTCLHGFTADERRFDDQRSIKVVCQSGAIDEEIDFSGCQLSEIVASDINNVGKPVLYTSEDFDVALLACPNVKAVYHPVRPLRDGKWVSGGFPEFNVAGEANGFELFGGTHLGCKNEGCYLNITVTEPELKRDDYWKMASGSPVFVGNNLVAVLKEYRPAAKGGFVVGYLQRLWDRNDGFQATIKKYIPNDFSYPRLEVKNMLEAEAHGDLVVELCGLVPSVNRENLADYLFALDELTTVRLFQRLSSGHKQIAKPLLVLLLSAVFEDPLIDEGGSDEQPYSNVNTVYEAPCEFLMAAHDNRPPEFLGDDFSFPRYSIATVENGIKSDAGEHFARNLLNGRADLKAIAKRILIDYRTAPGLDPEKIDVVKRAQKIIKYKKESYYWPVTLAEQQSDKFSEMVNIFPQIHILNRIVDEESYAKEAVLIDELDQFLKD